ncbi:MAG: topoisomerase [Fibrobacteria bacterium]|jgi:DNA topoisomerase-3|nr:topoisomerase [Fibrobacteria bacterium]
MPKTAVKAAAKTAKTPAAKKSAKTPAAPGAGKTLIIAEKPSVAQDLMKALPGKFEKHDNYWESEKYILSFALGHLVALATPKDMGDVYKSWSLDTLPIIPESFIIKALPKTKNQLSTLSKLIRRKDVTEVINACDAGREGELIFRYILQYVSETKPVTASIKRLWLQSMTKTAMEEGFQHLRDDAEMRNLAAAAQSRSEADWLVGINGSRALTGYQSRRGGFFLTPCGRVQTPTLSMIVQREHERNRFVARDYYEVHGLFGLADKQTYTGRWFDPAFKKDDQDDALRQERLWDKARADAIAAKCAGKNAEVTETSKPVTQSCPGLYDLTTLQREANGRFGFSAKTTLSIAQALYERHKALTYPRTDSRHLPEDYLPTVKGLMGSLREGEYGRFAAEALDKSYVRMDKKIFDGAKVSDHFAIIPTQVIPVGLSEAERKIYQMVTQRFIAVFFPVARFLQTTRISVVEGESFRTEGKVLESAGWKAIYGADVEAEDKDATMPALIPGKPVVAKEVEVRADRTRPPARLTESTLLSFMESAGKYVEDEELRDAMKERGLGTPATRAATIEGLLDDKYIVREGKELVPTAKGIELLGLLSAMQIEELTLPELTGEWEFKLNRMEKGKLTRAEFMQETQALTRKIVQRIKGYDEDKDKKAAGFVNPVDGKPMTETTSRWQSEDGKVVIRKVMGGRQMAPEEIVELLKNRRIGPLTGFRSKAGKPFAAAIRITDANKIEFVFDQADGEKAEIVNPEPLGKSPIDGSPVYETVSSYMSQSAIDGDAKQGFRLGKSILGKTLERENIVKMLSEGRSGLIQGFQSSKTRRFFDAYLKLNKAGKLEFEFPPREFKGKGGFKKKAATDGEE